MTSLPSQTIRPLAKADSAMALALRLRALREHPEAFGASYDEEAHFTPETFAERLTANLPDTVTLGVFHGETLVGSCTLVRRTHRKGRHRAHLNAMYVAPEARGSGAGRALVDAALAHARSLERVDIVIVAVNAENAAARRLYRASGFVTWGMEPRNIRANGRDYDVEWMALDLR